MCGVVFFGAFCSSISTVFICQNSCSVFYKKGGRAGLCLLLLYEIITVALHIVSCRAFLQPYYNVCMLVFFYQAALPFSVLPRQASPPHTPSLTFSVFSRPSRSETPESHRCSGVRTMYFFQLLRNSMTSSNFMISFSMLQDSFPHFLVFSCFFYLYVRPFVKDFKP